MVGIKPTWRGDASSPRTKARSGKPSRRIQELTALEERLAQMEEKQGVMADFLNHGMVEHLLKDATLGYVRVGRNLNKRVYRWGLGASRLGVG